ncbi:hypothetical protein BDV96DRAFT_583825 [Lophiotrema nucula]|uniref:Uncharacterized protein n=1 Tax=Lophiotrema nucula TaxID=690887 RepID=A0A6A5YUX2_9PLEO|nr:hypothetical protein BDV96DRAFT_583825 [Lophiotrema nucula]
MAYNPRNHVGPYIKKPERAAIAGNSRTPQEPHFGAFDDDLPYLTYPPGRASRVVSGTVNDPLGRPSNAPRLLSHIPAKVHLEALPSPMSLKAKKPVEELVNPPRGHVVIGSSLKGDGDGFMASFKALVPGLKKKEDIKEKRKGRFITPSGTDLRGRAKQNEHYNKQQDTRELQRRLGIPTRKAEPPMIWKRQEEYTKMYSHFASHEYFAKDNEESASSDKHGKSPVPNEAEPKYSAFML